jgi:hypothetical protein
MCGCGSERGGEESRQPSAEISGEDAERAQPSAPAILADGPVLRFGILALPANATKYFEGTYTQGFHTIIVRYSEENIVIPAEWVTTRCGTLPLRFTVENNTVHYAYSQEETWAVLFELPDEYELSCAFIERFLQRLRYFKSVSESEEAVPFPAIVEAL